MATPQPLRGSRGPRLQVRAAFSPPTAGAMARVVKLPRRPMHPGHFLETRFLRPTSLTQDELARRLGISRRRVNELVRGRRGVSADTALRLALCFGLEAEFWLRLQAAWDAHVAWRRFGSGGNEDGVDGD